MKRKFCMYAFIVSCVAAMFLAVEFANVGAAGYKAGTILCVTLAVIFGAGYWAAGLAKSSDADAEALDY